MRPATGKDADQQLLDRAARRLGLQAASLAAFALLAVSAVLGLLVLHEQRGDDQALIHHAAKTADDVDDPPAGMWLVISARGQLTATDGLPAGLPAEADIQAVQAGSGPVERRVEVGGRHVVLGAPSRPAAGVGARAAADLRR